MAHILKIIAGFALIIAGVFMLFFPGPGILTIAAGLALLRRDLAWAGRLSEWVKRRFVAKGDERPST